MEPQEANNYWAAEAETTQQPTSDGEPTTEETPVMARIPDLDASTTSDEAATERSRPHGRMLSPSLSIKLLAAGAVLLILGALIPYAMNREDAPRDPRPAPDAGAAPAFASGPTQGAKAQPPIPIVRPAPPSMTFKANIPAGPAKQANRDLPKPRVQAARPPQKAATKATVQPGPPGDKAPPGDNGQPGLRSTHVRNPYALPKQHPATVHNPTLEPRVSSRPQDTQYDNRSQLPVAGGQTPAEGGVGASSPWPKRQASALYDGAAASKAPPAFQQPDTSNTYAAPT